MHWTGGGPRDGRKHISGLKQDQPHLDDRQAGRVLRPLLDDGPDLPWSSGALRPAALVVICNEIVHRRRTRIVECGSGTSTIVLARLLRQQSTGGRLVALEHDAGWVERVTDMLRRESLDAIAHVVHAPLEGEPPWYARTALAQTSEDIELLIVDGPPAFDPGHGRRREPALDAFDPRLDPAASVILDDIDRPGEQQVLAAWRARPGWTFAVDDRAGVAIGSRR
jgi:predicted O-methyltransferase YrrM